MYTLYCPGTVASPSTITVLWESRTTHDAVTTILLGLVPTDALQLCPMMNVPPDIVIVLSAYATAGFALVNLGALATIKTASADVAATLLGLVIFNDTELAAAGVLAPMTTTADVELNMKQDAAVEDTP